MSSAGNVGVRPTARRTASLRKCKGMGDKAKGGKGKDKGDAEAGVDATGEGMREVPTGLGDANWDFWVEMYMQNREVFNAVEEVVAWVVDELTDEKNEEVGKGEGGSA